MNISRLIAQFLSTLLIAIRPALGPAHCFFTVSCTKYALLTLKTEPLGKAIWLIIQRLRKCVFGLF
ncbi:MAG: membrane protein insertion efficiency factor YidD [Candidatus Babeliales bacterium]